MRSVKCHQSKLLAKSLSNSAIILFAQICPIRSLTKLFLTFLVLKPSFLASLSVCQVQSTKLRFQKMTSTMQTYFQSRSSHCHALFAFIAGGDWQYAKLRLTSSLVWSFANNRQLRLKAILNDRFSLVLLDGKSGRDEHSTSESREAKVGAASSKDAFLIIWFH